MKLIEILPNSKRPAGKNWNVSSDPTVHEQWLKKGNIGFLPEENGCVVVDFDEKEAARQFYRRHKNLCTVMVETRRGIHLYFSGKTNTRKIKDEEEKDIGDVKGNGYVVFPPSVVDGWEYKFIPGYEWKGVENLKPFPEELFWQNDSTNGSSMASSLPGEESTLRIIRRARAWAAKVEPAIMGQHGSDKMFYFCCQMFQKFGLTVDQAIPIILEYNARCVPPFSDKEIEHKIEDAEKCTTQ